MTSAAHRRTSMALGLALAWPVPATALGARRARQEPTTGAGSVAAPATPSRAERGPSASAPAIEAAAPDAAPDAEPDAASDAEPDAEVDPTTLTPEQLREREQAFNFAEGRRHFNEGERLHHAGRYAEAAVEFERSHAAWPAASTLYNIALSYERAGKAVEAVRALEGYLALTDCNTLPPEQRTIDCAARRPEALEALEQQRRRVGELTLKIAEGVELREVRVAGRTVPLDDFPLLMLPGTVDVELFGMGPNDRRTRPAYITAGEVYEVYVAPFETGEVVPPPIVPSDPEGDDPRRSEQRGQRLRIAFWSGLGLTAAAGVATGVMGGLTRYHQRRFDAEKCPSVCFELGDDGELVLDDGGDPIPLDRPYPFDHERAFERYKPVTNALVGVTIGLAVGTALVGIFAFRKREPEPAGPARVRVHMGAPGLVVRW